MSMQNDLEIFQRAVDARGRLLRVEGAPLGTTPQRLAMTFDIGRILLEPQGAGLSVTHLEASDSIPAGLQPLDEEEPWWRLLGNPITAAWPGGAEESVAARSAESLPILKLRFREESENPKVVVLEASGPSLRVSIEG
jgi:hypothetical protein